MDWKTATDEEADSYAAESIMRWSASQKWWAYRGSVMVEPVMLRLDWHPSTDRDQADMCLAKFWDRWAVELTRYKPGRWIAMAKCNAMLIMVTVETTESRCRLNLAIALHMWEAENATLQATE